MTILRNNGKMYKIFDSRTIEFVLPIPQTLAQI